VKIMKTIFPVILLMAACAAVGTAQGSAGDRGAPNSAQPTISNLPQGWQLYSLGSRDTFKVAMPKKPETESEEIKSGNKPIKITYFTSSSDAVLTIIADIYDLPLNADSLTEANKMDLFKKVREGLVAGMKSELDKNGVKTEIKFYTQKSVTLRGVSGYEQALDVGPFKGRTRMLSVKDHIYIFFTMLLDDSQESLMGEFLDSFNYTGTK